jgi:hypothetical protein
MEELVQTTDGLKFRGVKVVRTGNMEAGLRKVRTTFLEQMDLRFANRGVLGSLTWLDVGQASKRFRGLCPTAGPPFPPTYLPLQWLT